jgi:hypothetical protein
VLQLEQLLLDYHNRVDNVLASLEDLREDVDATGFVFGFGFVSYFIVKKTKKRRLLTF